MQTQGSLSDGGLGALLETMQAERATGTLAVQNGSSSCSLYFLFGHLFHAAGPDGRQGEDVVVDALGWHDGSFQFDPRAKLPAEETIKSSPAELIAASQSRQDAPSQGPVLTQESYFSSVVEHQAEPQPDQYAGGLAADPASAAPQAPPDPEGSGLASWAASQHGYEAPPIEPIAYPTPAPQHAAAPQPAPLASEPRPAPQPYVAPEPAHSSQIVTAAFGGDRGGVYYPLPSGRSHYEGLKSAFVDFPRLLRTLRSDHHTGYVRVTGTGGRYGGFILLHEGQALEALSSNGVVTQGETAFLHIRRHMDNGDGALDVVELEGDIVQALARLYTGVPLFVGLLGRFVNLDALLEYLQEEQLDGSIIVTTEQGLGVILLETGGVLGSYTDAQRALEASTEPAAALAHEKTSRIEVKGPPQRPTPLDVESALNLPY